MRTGRVGQAAAVSAFLSIFCAVAFMGRAHAAIKKVVWTACVEQARQSRFSRLGIRSGIFIVA
ncbi:hypothetical protein [Polaromonas sp. CG9_12]|nr:hypothetical protein [Polaromonas sp. CG9_12]